MSSGMEIVEQTWPPPPVCFCNDMIQWKLWGGGRQNVEGKGLKGMVSSDQWAVVSGEKKRDANRREASGRGCWARITRNGGMPVSIRHVNSINGRN
jgi:hypothetical protein